MSMETPIPEDFWEVFRTQFPQEDFIAFRHALEKESNIGAIRPNLHKRLTPDKLEALTTPLGKGSPVPWYPQALLIDQRPLFATRYEWQAGYCYIQEPSSMAIAQIAPSLPSRPLKVLDLCAAPGGKSTLLIDLLPSKSTIISNEPIAKRASILEENLLRWGYPNTIVTRAYSDQFLATDIQFDLILVDAPCSGEGMFRKSEAARQDWSLEAIEACVARQREILDIAWQLLAPQGVLLYSTCTFNHQENEENVQYMLQKDSCHHIALSPQQEWGFLNGKEGLGWRALPHRTKGEGFYWAPMQKDGEKKLQEKKKRKKRNSLVREIQVEIPQSILSSWLSSESLQEEYHGIMHSQNELYALSQTVYDIYEALLDAKIPIRHAGIPLAQQKGKHLTPHPLLPFSTQFEEKSFPTVPLNDKETLQYFSGEALQKLSEVSSIPNGVVCVTREGYPIGFANAVSGRLNNLFPKNFRLRQRNFS